MHVSFIQMKYYFCTDFLFTDKQMGREIAHKVNQLLDEMHN